MKIKLSLVFTLFIVAVIGIAYLLMVKVNGEKKNFNEELFETQANAFIHSLQQRYARNELVLEGLEGLFKSSDEVSLAEWNINVENLKLTTKFPAISWIAYIKKIPRSELQSSLNNIRSQVPNFKIWPEDNNATLCPIVYINPNTYSNLIGYDLKNAPEEINALEESAKIKKLTTAPPFRTEVIKQSKSERILFLPILGKESSTQPGWIAAAVDFATIIGETAEGMHLDDFEINAYLGEGKQLNNLIFQQQIPSPSADLFTYTKVFDFAGTKWTFEFAAEPTDQSPFSAYSFFLILFLLLITLAVGLFLYFYYLKKSGYVNLDTLPEKLILASTQYAFVGTDKNGLITYWNPAAERLLGYSAGEMVGKQTPKTFHDPEEMKQRAEELSKILGREVKPEFEVFVAFAEKNTPENKRWIYIRKDQSRITVQLSVTALRNASNEIVGYLGVAIEASQINI